MAMVEAVWPSEQLAAALSNPPETQPLDPADPQVSFSATDRTKQACHMQSLARDHCPPEKAEDASSQGSTMTPTCSFCVVS